MCARSLWVLLFPVAILCAAPAAAQAPRNLRLPASLPHLAYSHDIGSAGTIASVTDVALFGSHGLVVLDGESSSLSLFDIETGRLMAQTGRRGRGAGGFVYPVALSASGRTVSVLDQGTERLVVFDVEKDAFTYVGDIVIPVLDPSDVCSVAGRYYVLGRLAGGLIHEVSGTGEVARSFGRPSRGDPLSGELSGQGKLACSNEGRLVAYVSLLFGNVAIYRTTGELLWEGQVPGFEGQKYEYTNRVLRPLPPAAGFRHVVEGFQWLANGDLWIQVRKSSDGHHQPHSAFVLRPSYEWDVDPQPRPTTLIIDPSFLVLLESAPHPRLKVYRVR